MGLMFRRRRPVMRMAAGAATAGVAYHAGQAHAEREQEAQMAAQAPPDAYPQYTPPPPAPSPPPAADGGADPAASIEQLAALHNSGALTDEEFAAAKAKILGI